MATPTSLRPTPLYDKGLTPLIRLSGLRRRRRTLAALAGASLLLGAGAVWFLGPGRNGNRDLSAYTVAAERGTLPGVVTASGELEAVQCDIVLVGCVCVVTDIVRKCSGHPPGFKYNVVPHHSG